METDFENYYSVYQERAMDLSGRLAEIEALLKELDLDLLDKEIQEEHFVGEYEKLHPREVAIVAARVGSEVRIAELVKERHRLLAEILNLGMQDNESYHNLKKFESRYIN